MEVVCCADEVGGAVDDALMLGLLLLLLLVLLLLLKLLLLLGRVRAAVKARGAGGRGLGVHAAAAVVGAVGLDLILSWRERVGVAQRVGVRVALTLAVAVTVIVIVAGVLGCCHGVNLGEAGAFATRCGSGAVAGGAFDAVSVADSEAFHSEPVADFDVASGGAVTEHTVATFLEALERDETDTAIFVSKVGPDKVVEDVLLYCVDSERKSS